MLMYRVFIVIIGCFLLQACSKDPVAEPTPEKEIVDVKIENMAYGSDARQKMDVYLPKSRKTGSPLVIMIHGGFWLEGDKSGFSQIQQQLFAMGISSVNLNYRYVSANHHYDGLMQDIRLAIDKIKSEANEWSLYTNSIHLAGFSAGGHMALLYGYSAKRANEIKSVISIAGPTFFDEQYLNSPLFQQPATLSAITWLTGAPLPTSTTDPNYLIYQQVSPLTHVSAAVPTLLLHGSADEIVPFSQSGVLKSVLDQRNIRAKLVTLQGAGHDVSASPLHMIQILLEVPSWLDAQK
jgi:acetyl esterase/lipase